ncbi:conserved hypothetical protein [Alphaproteobacteria bacterium]
MGREDSYIDYAEFVDEAMYGVIRRVLRVVMEKGLPGDHHFYISFLVNYFGVIVPPHLLHKHPHRMTIVLQNQFEDLVVHQERFEVSLTFNEVEERIVVPIAAITEFFDPSAQFGVRLKQHLLGIDGQIPDLKVGQSFDPYKLFDAKEHAFNQSEASEDTNRQHLKDDEKIIDIRDFLEKK